MGCLLYVLVGLVLLCECVFGSLCFVIVCFVFVGGSLLGVGFGFVRVLGCLYVVDAHVSCIYLVCYVFGWINLMSAHLRCPDCAR